MYIRLTKHCLTHTAGHDRLVNLANVCVIQTVQENRKTREDLSWLSMVNGDSFVAKKPMSFFRDLEMSGFIEIMALPRKEFLGDPNVLTLLRRDKICHIEPGDTDDHDTSKTSFYMVDGVIVCAAMQYDEAAVLLPKHVVH